MSATRIIDFDVIDVSKHLHHLSRDSTVSSFDTCHVDCVDTLSTCNPLNNVLSTTLILGHAPHIPHKTLINNFDQNDTCHPPTNSHSFCSRGHPFDTLSPSVNVYTPICDIPVSYMESLKYTHTESMFPSIDTIIDIPLSSCHGQTSLMCIDDNDDMCPQLNHDVTSSSRVATHINISFDSNINDISSMLCEHEPLTINMDEPMCLSMPSPCTLVTDGTMLSQKHPHYSRVSDSPYECALCSPIPIDVVSSLAFDNDPRITTNDDVTIFPTHSLWADVFDSYFSHYPCFTIYYNVGNFQRFRGLSHIFSVYFIISQICYLCCY